MNGSGKTTLLEYILSRRRFSICIDSKRELRFPGFEITERGDAAFQAEHVILRPRSLDEVEYVFARALEEGAWTVAPDEVYMISTSPGSARPETFPPSYILSLTRGRSKHVSVITGTQRPKFIPLFAFTESVHLFAFELGSRDDMKYLLQNAGIWDQARGVVDEIHGHRFLYYGRRPRRLVMSELDLGAAA